MNNKLLDIIIASVFGLLILGIVGYLIVFNNKKIEITLLGDNPYILTVGDYYNEPGFKAMQGNKDVSSKIFVSSSINTNKVGTYKVLYYINNALVSERIVKVEEKKSNQNNSNQNISPTPKNDTPINDNQINQEQEPKETIKKKNDSIIIKLVEKVYTGSEIKATAKATSNTKITITYYSDSKCTKKTSTPKAIGTYYAIAKSAGNTSYNEGTSSCTKAVVITKKPVQIKVGSFNIGYFKCGSSKKATCTMTWQKLGDYLKPFNLSIIGLQEIGTSEGAATSLLKRAGFSNRYSAFRHGWTMVGSKYAISSSNVTDLERCDQTRGITKSIIKINGVNISYYNMHLGRDRDGCNTNHFKKLASLVKNDKNPVIMTGDFNQTSTDKFNTYLKPLGAVVAAYDTSTNNMWGKKSYCDMVVVIPKNHIKVVGNKTEETFKKYSDHNFIYATLNIY